VSTSVPGLAGKPIIDLLAERSTAVKHAACLN